MSVLTLSPKVTEGAKTIVSSSANLEKQSDEDEYAAPFAASGEPAALTEIEQALQLFSSRAEQIPGVIRVGRYRVGLSEEEGVMVVVANLFSPITHEVIQAQERIYDAMPGIRFCLDIKYIIAF